MDNQFRVTGQVSPRNKLSGFYDRVNKCNCPTIADVATQTGESGTRLTYPPSYLMSLSWQSTISSKLLFDGAISYNRQPTDNEPQPEANITFATASVLELSTLRRLRAPFHGGSEGNSDQAQRVGRAAISYVTGSHSLKVGMNWRNGWTSAGTYPFSSNLGLQLLNGAAVVGRVAHRSVHDPAQRERRHGHLCPGPVDDPPDDALGRCPVRLLQQQSPRDVGGRDAVCGRALVRGH